MNDPLFGSDADWISPGYDDEIFASGELFPQMPGAPPTRWLVDPPSNDGRKVVINDTDHYSMSADALWAWKSFIRGHHPILMDYGLIGGPDPADPSAGAPMSFEAFEPARWAMGDTVRLAGTLNLVEMKPRDDVSSTEFDLANEGSEYVILQPTDSADPFDVNVAPGTYEAEWFSVQSRETRPGDRVIIEVPGPSRFMAPFGGGPSVLILRRA